MNRLFEIWTWEDLWNIRNVINLGGVERVDYRLMRDLTPDMADYDLYASSTARDGAGFKCLGDETTSNDLQFDGQGHVIKGLYIGEAGNDGNWGLFGRIADGAEIKDLFFDDLTLNRSGGSHCGLLFPRSAGNPTVTNVHIRNAHIISSAATNGGIVGHCQGGTFTDVSVHGTIEGTARSAGIAGRCLTGNAAFVRCHADVTIPSTGSTTRGGFVGTVEGGHPTFTDCYARGSITQDRTDVGGFCGEVQDGASATFTRCYAAVSLEASAGGFLGEDNSGAGTVTADDCFYDTTIGQSASAAGTGKTTAEMQDIDTYTDTATTGLDNPWDMVAEASHDNEVWKIAASSYPDLRYEPVDVSLEEQTALALHFKIDGKMRNANPEIPARFPNPAGSQFPNLAGLPELSGGTPLAGAEALDDDVDYVIENKASGGYLRGVGNTMIWNRAVDTRKLANDTRFLWAIIGDGADFDVRSVSSGLRLDVRAWAIMDGEPFQVMMPSVIDAERPLWEVVHRGDGFFSFVLKRTNKALTLVDGAIVQQPWATLDTQLWRIRPAEVPTETPNFDMQGWAEKFGVTGGAGGPTVTADNIGDFIAALEADNDPAIVQWSGVFDYDDLDSGHPNWRSNRNIRVRKNKTILGMGTGAEIRNAEFRVGGSVFPGPDDAGNCIIRNVTHRYTQDLNSTNMIVPSGAAQGVWIDHCDFVNDASGVNDSAWDLTEGDYVTVSWCRHRNLARTAGMRKNVRATVHHNWWEDCAGIRNPNLRSTRAHMFNNLWEAPSLRDSLSIRQDDGPNQLVYECNYTPRNVRGLNVFMDDTDQNAMAFRGRANINRYNENYYLFLVRKMAEGAIVPSEEYDYILNHPLNVLTLVKAHSGVGKGPYAP